MESEKERLVIEGNAVYALDLECVKRKAGQSCSEVRERKKGQEEQGRKRQPPGGR